MVTFAYLLTVICATVTLCVFLYFRVKKELYKAIFFKAITSFLFIACAFGAMRAFISGAYSYIPALTPYAALIILGLLCGLFGDLWLDLKNMHPEAKDTYQFIGMGSFLASHFFFIPAMYFMSETLSGLFMPEHWYQKSIWQMLIGIGFGLLFAIGVMVFEKPMKVHYGKYKLITFFYSFTIGTSTGFSAAMFFGSGFETASMFLMIGMALVLISDVILSGTYFGEGKDRPVDIISNHVLYYVGQFFVASSLLFV